MQAKTPNDFPLSRSGRVARSLGGAVLCSWLMVMWVSGVSCKNQNADRSAGSAGRQGGSMPRSATGQRYTERAAQNDGGVRDGRGDEPIADPVWLYRDGTARKVSAAWARRQGYTIIDLSDDWAPFLFTERSADDAVRKPNFYRKRYIGLANDRSDNWGKPLKKGERNYLELYGIPPSLSVVRKRFLEDEKKQCFQKIDYSVFEQKLPYAIRYKGKKKRARFKKRYQSRKRYVRKIMRRLNLKSLDALAKRAKYRWAVAAYRKNKAVYEALVEAQKRLVCEGFLKPKRHRPGHIDWYTHLALKRFERKHMVFGWGFIWRDTRKALGRTPLQNNYRTLIRVLRERVATTVPILEDGSVKKWKDRKGRVHKVRNLVAEFTKAAQKHLGWTSPEKAAAFFRHPPKATFDDFRVALKLPALPQYYKPPMKFSILISRGDVWYAFPYDEKGNKTPQPRSLKPKLIVYVHHHGQRIPLVKWRTTIGGWRSEMRDGYEYWRYKNSPTGRWLWKYVVAAPVWFPPTGTPPRDLVKTVKRKGRWRTVVKHEEMGPGYRSAYGLVAALHTQERRRGSVVEDIDHGIRTHGSVAYMSIRNGHSHGCHRLYNHLAVRLHCFLLQRHAHERMGQVDKKWTFPFKYKKKRYVVRLDTKGYYYRYVPPIPIVVSRGRLRGKQKEPLRGFMKKANVKYPTPDGGVDGGTATDGGDGGVQKNTNGKTKSGDGGILDADR